MASSSRSFRNVTRVSLGADASEQLKAIQEFRSRDSKVGTAVSKVATKAAEVSSRSSNRQQVEQWCTTFGRLGSEAADREAELENAWTAMEEKLFALSEVAVTCHQVSPSPSASAGDPQHHQENESGAGSLSWLRRNIKIEGDQLKKSLLDKKGPLQHPIYHSKLLTRRTRFKSPPSVPTAVSSSLATSLAQSSKKLQKVSSSSSQQFSATRSSARSSSSTSKSNDGINNNNATARLLQQDGTAAVSELLSRETAASQDTISALDHEIEQLTSDLHNNSSSSQQAHQTHHSGNNHVSSSTSLWFLPRVAAPSLDAVSSDWLNNFQPISDVMPEFLGVSREHQQSQQTVLDELAKAANATREALLECGSTRDLERLWCLWQAAPAVVGGGVRGSRRERVLASAKTENLFGGSGGSGGGGSAANDALDLLLMLKTQQRELKTKYVAAVECVMQQMKRLSDVVVALQTLQAAEDVHSSFLTELEEDQASAKARVSKLRQEKDIIKEQRAAEQAARDEEERRRQQAVKERQQREEQARLEALDQWNAEKQEKQRAAEEQAARDAAEAEERNREALQVAIARVQQRARIDEMKQLHREQQRDEEQREQLAKEAKLQEFFSKADEKVGVARDPKRVLANTASSDAGAALVNSVGEACAKFSSTGHGYSTQAIVKDARFRLAEALSMAGLTSSAYARNVMRDTFATRALPSQAARGTAMSQANPLQQ